MVDTEKEFKVELTQEADTLTVTRQRERKKLFSDQSYEFQEFTIKANRKKFPEF